MKLDILLRYRYTYYSIITYTLYRFLGELCGFVNEATNSHLTVFHHRSFVRSVLAASQAELLGTFPNLASGDLKRANKETTVKSL